MITVKKYKLLFFELPRTGTTSIRNKFLKENIGEIHPAIHRHGSISKFKRLNYSEFDDFTIVSCLRNPMDRVLSLYVKLKRDHKNHYSQLALKEKKTILEKIILRKYHDVQKNNLSFEDYFLKYFNLPYVDWMYFDMSSCDEIIKFENLQEDFTNLVRKYNIDIDEKLPVNNKVNDKPHFMGFYTPRIQKRAQFVFSIYMKKTGYKFPKDWSPHKESVVQKVAMFLALKLYKFVNLYLK